ncbi:MAG: methionine--tRNA ligase [Treponema sp.]|jgi:methionyl-tRNA synthetase|nr:methionine--tRNA ligase [Treponema sp.]
MKRRLITSALPYVNNVPHLGNLIQVLSADCFARFCRLRGYDTLYVCGTDEYGTATETRAAEEGISPRELCNHYHAIHADIYQWFNIAFDKFGRTSTEIQTAVTQDIFKKLDANGFITEHTVKQLHCPKCNRFLADRYVRGTCPHCGHSEARGDQCENCGKLLEPTELKDPRCSTCGTPPSLKETKHLYINLPKIKDSLETWIKTAADKGFWANNAIAMTESWIRDGLHERAITRDLKWGIPVPKAGFEDKVFYVWFDAPIGYISITGTLGDRLAKPSDEDAGQTVESWQTFIDDWWKNPENVELFQFIGKDNIPFHTVIFPSSLLGTGEKWTMLHHMSSTEYLNYESGKFSKSRGIGVFGTDAMETGIPADVWRFYIFYNRPEKSDALFTWKDFQEKVNSELLGNLGNLVNRTLAFVNRYYGGQIPENGADNAENWEIVRKFETKITESLERAELRDAFHTVFELSAFANKVFQNGEPWKKRNDSAAEAESLIRFLAYIVRDIAVLAAPFIPQTAERIASFLGLSLEKGKSKAENVITWADIGKPQGLSRIVKAEVLFSRLETEQVEFFRQKYSGTQKEREESQKNENSIQKTFSETVDLRVAQIVNVERHPNADKLYIETLDVGGETRIIVSGLVPFYKPDELLNKHIVVVYNLKPVRLRGVESRGMLLAASTKDTDGNEIVEVLDALDAPIGTRILVDTPESVSSVPSAQSVQSEITIDVFTKFPVVVKNGMVQINGKGLVLLGKPIVTQKVLNGEVH